MKFSISENEVENVALLRENKLKYLADKRLIEKENGNILYEKFENYLSDGVYNVIKDNIKYPVFVKTKKTLANYMYCCQEVELQVRPGF